ncbi:hypothetical protein ON010_g5532 [Phytophthora cinnamomi]|nr:hypothetical protein ON010_g5532 [Phytophthora cinnamomi]
MGGFSESERIISQLQVTASPLLHCITAARLDLEKSTQPERPSTANDAVDAAVARAGAPGAAHAELQDHCALPAAAAAHLLPQDRRLRAQQLPARGPVILCPNHPNMLVDAILVMTEAASHGRNPYVWAKGSLFSNPVAAFILKKLGAVPVYRPRRKEATLADVDSDKTPEELEAANKAMFEHTWRVLADGNVMVLFPEGTSYTAPKMLSLRTGVVRVATGFAKHYDQPIPIIPLGLNYFNKDHFRSQMTLEFGPPMVITPDMVQSEAFQQDEHSEVKRLTHELEERMHDVTLNASDFSTIHAARMMRRLYLNTPGTIDANKEVRLTQYIINMLEKEPKDEEQKERVAAIRKKVMRYKEQLEKLRLKDQEVNLPMPKEQSLLQLFLGRILYLLVLLPLATPGLLLNFPYYFIGELCVLRFVVVVELTSGAFA